ncbi:glycosyltransferase family 2 protein [Rickenella mellea]|uniref:Chitin synthase n=1 Tax=Rickenella mellea TaxID=50990 RepID=A0A4Y7PTF9_9AGAM|nr:glycosyltransferase family 2 protein [Rickenella mellea]
MSSSTEKGDVDVSKIRTPTGPYAQHARGTSDIEKGLEEAGNQPRVAAPVLRRYKPFRNANNLVIDVDVPSKLLGLCAKRSEREFTHMRYSAVTCDPNDFQSCGFTLRQVHYDPPRRTELFIVVTMSNEDDILFCQTMHGVMENISHLCGRNRSKTWGKDAWKKVVVCIVSDGGSELNLRTISVLTAMGAYQSGFAKRMVNNIPVAAHVYEYTTQISVSPSMTFEGAESGVVPVQIIFCVKDKPRGKINSHRWFFNAFVPILQPNICVLLDAGIRPGPTSIYHLWKSFDIVSGIGGTCGEVVVSKGIMGRNLLNPLVAAQDFEYRMSLILETPLESVFGYIRNLPSGFSAYRYIALQNDSNGNGPLVTYFNGEKILQSARDTSLITLNVQLEASRVLCWELAYKRGGQWILHYVKSAYAFIEVPRSIPELLLRHQRSQNSSFFAMIHIMARFTYIYRSSHSILRKFWIHIEMLYHAYTLVFNWFAIGNYYVVFKVLTDSLEDPSFHLAKFQTANIVLDYFYLGMLFVSFLLAMGKRPQSSRWGYTICFVGFGLITIYMLTAGILLAVKTAQNIQHGDSGPLRIRHLFSNLVFRNVVIPVIVTAGLNLLASILFFEPWHMVTSFVQYLLIVPSYISVLSVYAVANVHRLSLGDRTDDINKPDRKGIDQPVIVEKDVDEEYEDAIHMLQTDNPKGNLKGDVMADRDGDFRMKILLAWSLSNALLAAIVISVTGKAADKGVATTINGYISFVFFSLAGLTVFRFVGSTTYMLVRLFVGE